jgi:hypothetical protein
MKKILSIVLVTVFALVSVNVAHLKSAYAVGCQGCCSWHGGINRSAPCNYYTNHLRCNDGMDSPTCQCSCLSGSTSSYGSGGGGNDAAAAVAAGALAVGLTALIAAAAAENDPNKEMYGRKLQQAIKMMEKGKTNSTLAELRTGIYTLRSDSCRHFPAAINLMYASNARPIIIDRLKESIGHIRDRESRKETKKQIKDMQNATISPVSHYAMTGDNHSSYLYYIFPDGSMYIPDPTGKKAICSGQFQKANEYKILKMYCATQSGRYCRTQYVHESGNANTRNKGFRNKMGR